MGGTPHPNVATYVFGLELNTVVCRQGTHKRLAISLGRHTRVRNHKDASIVRRANEAASGLLNR